MKFLSLLLSFMLTQAQAASTTNADTTGLNACLQSSCINGTIVDCTARCLNQANLQDLASALQACNSGCLTLDTYPEKDCTNNCLTAIIQQATSSGSSTNESPSPTSDILANSNMPNPDDQISFSIDPSDSD
ncbi:hypothetical protein BB559_006513, partial [Furculomyces boomerangus]